MNRERIREYLIKATTSLGHPQIEIVEWTGRSFTIRIVSDFFEGKSILKRFEVLSALIEDLTPEIATTYLFDFEAWTQGEFLDLKTYLVPVK